MSDGEVMVAADPLLAHVRNSGTGGLPSSFIRALVPVASIVVHKGLDEVSISNVEMLAEIVQKYGLRDAITITADRRLIAGARWLAAVRKLGWEYVEVAVVDGAA